MFNNFASADLINLCLVIRNTIFVDSDIFSFFQNYYFKNFYMFIIDRQIDQGFESLIFTDFDISNEKSTILILIFRSLNRKNRKEWSE